MIGLLGWWKHLTLGIYEREIERQRRASSACSPADTCNDFVPPSAGTSSGSPPARGDSEPGDHTPESETRT